MPDVFQDVVVAAYASLARYDPERPAYPWLCGIAFNVVRAWRRKLNQERSIILPVAEIFRPMFKRLPRRETERPMSKPDVRSAVRPGPCLIAKPAPPLRAFLPRNGERPSTADVALCGRSGRRRQAARLGTSRGAVRVKRCRAIRRLREAYALSERIAMEGK